MSLLSEHLAIHSTDTARNQIEAVSVPRISSIGLVLDFGIVPSNNANKSLISKISRIGVTIDYGAVPNKNYFPTRINTLGIIVDTIPANLMIQVL